jgi:hypothetical protein
MPAAEDFRLADGVNLQTALVQAGAPAKALIPSSGVLGNTWTGGNEAAFASLGGDASWLSGASGAGYQRAGTDNNFAGLYGIDVAAMDHGNDSVYVRIPFNVSTQEVLNSITSLSLQMRYDDGFVAYLNGVKVAAANAPASPQWNSGATASVTDGAAVVPVSFDITAFKGSLKVGANILAIQGLNQAGANSSDLLVLPELIATRTTTTPSVVNDSVVDVSGRGWVNVREIRVAGDPTPLAVTWSSPTTWTARVPLQPGLNALTLEAYDFQGNKITTPYPNNLTVTSTLSERPYQDFLKISEIMYHPADPTTAELAAGFADSDEFEFLEFFNASETETLDLNGVRIVSGPSAEFNFSGSNVTSLGPGESVIVVRNQAAFEARYGTSLSNRIAGVYEGKLDNAGELLAVIDPAGVDIERFTYDDVAPWPVEADGLGYSLVRVAPRSMTNPALASSWKASYVLGGSPAAIDLASGPSAADFTLDAAVGPPDLTVWKSGFGTALTVGYNAGDADGDHDVDGADFLTWQRSLGLSSFPASPNIMVNASANVRAAEEPVAVIDVGSEGERDIESRLPSLAAGRLLGGDLRSRDLAFAAIGSAAAKLAGHDNDHWLRRQSHAKSPSILSVESCTWLDDQPINSVARSLVSHDKSKDSLLRVVQNRWPTEASAGDVEIQSLRRYLTTALPRGFLRRRQA